MKSRNFLGLPSRIDFALGRYIDVENLVGTVKRVRSRSLANSYETYRFFIPQS